MNSYQLTSSRRKEQKIKAINKKSKRRTRGKMVSHFQLSVTNVEAKRFPLSFTIKPEVIESQKS